MRLTEFDSNFQPKPLDGIHIQFLEELIDYDEFVYLLNEAFHDHFEMTKMTAEKWKKVVELGKNYINAGYFPPYLATKRQSVT